MNENACLTLFANSSVSTSANDKCIKPNVTVNKNVNRRFAPDLYLGVVSILEREGKLQILADEENKHG